MNILGLIYSTNSTAALIQDGKITASVSEERFVRQKNTNRYPKNAVEYCLAQAGITAKDLDHVALCGFKENINHLLVDHDAHFSLLDKIQEQKEYWYPKLYENKTPDYLKLYGNKVSDEMKASYDSYQKTKMKDDFRTFLIKEHLGAAVKVTHYHHHTSHLYYSLLSKKSFDVNKKQLIFCMEGFGDDANASVSLYEKGAIKYLMKTDQCFLGRFYRYVTLILNMKTNEHEFKVMGLAPYATKYHYQRALDIFKETMFVDGIKGFDFHKRPQDSYFYFKEALEGTRFDGIAGGIQKYAEEIIIKWVQNWIKETGVADISFTGGVGMNIKAMMELSKLEEVDDLWVGASVSDESIAMGACFYAWHETNNEMPMPLENVYLGPEYFDQDVEVAIQETKANEKYKVQKYPGAEYAAELLAEGKVLSRCCGRMEFGSRALGNRSIIADPRYSDIVRKINSAIKNRDFWMPFAPVVLKERVVDYLENPKGLDIPYMSIGLETTPDGRKALPAGLHPADFTARPQFITEEMNPGYYNIVKAFEKKTGVGALLNTSFNLHGEPIVNTPKDALRVFENSDLDVLILGNYILEKITAI